MLLLLALLVLASLGQHGARAAATWETLGAKTFSGALLPTVAEWRESFRSEHSRHGLVHVWLRCLQGGPNAEPWVRAYFYVETSGAPHRGCCCRWGGTGGRGSTGGPTRARLWRLPGSPLRCGACAQRRWRRR